MKKFFCFIVLLFASISYAHAHSQSPVRFGGGDNLNEAVTFSGVSVVNITVGNLNSFPQSYGIYVDGEFERNSKVLAPNEFTRMQIYVMSDEVNEPETHKVCSKSIPRQGVDMFVSRVCTKLEVIWIKPDTPQSPIAQ